jgi:hypothetical protein
MGINCVEEWFILDTHSEIRRNLELRKFSDFEFVSGIAGGDKFWLGKICLDNTFGLFVFRFGAFSLESFESVVSFVGNLEQLKVWWSSLDEGSTVFVVATIYRSE